jgi:hypothetical protein
MGVGGGYILEFKHREAFGVLLDSGSNILPYCVED